MSDSQRRAGGRPGARPGGEPDARPAARAQPAARAPTAAPGAAGRSALPVVESLAERRIREAMERGEFDGLPGAGKPIEGIDGPHDDLWWVKQKVRRERLSELEAEAAERSGDAPRGAEGMGRP
ncbi:DnaJ family domain-containing protein [Motilibacter deserti]|uniref:DUF1992 domain-containing protein n=1 Tax=Motilibacter deserti TaxID=2714956 RepID=A0ABX0GVG5_9ACTN|nr:DUF1992 domain-containing protein [Motilibacter deserti]NHC14921.1 DUF1992 domain-containing protein [Motilibacter deserti]